MVRFFPAGLRIDKYTPYTARGTVTSFRGTKIACLDICFVETGVEVPRGLCRQESYDFRPVSKEQVKPWFDGFCLEPGANTGESEG